MKLGKMNSEKLAVKWKKGVSKDYSRLKNGSTIPTKSPSSKEEKTESRNLSSFSTGQKKVSSRVFTTIKCLPARHDRSELYPQPTASKDYQDTRPMPCLVKEKVNLRKLKRKLSKDDDISAPNLRSKKSCEAPKISSKGIHDSDAPCLFAEPHLLDFEYKVEKKAESVQVPRNRSKSVPCLPSTYNLRNNHKLQVFTTLNASNPKYHGDDLCGENNSTEKGFEKMKYENSDSKPKSSKQSEVKVVKCQRCVKPMSYLSKTQCCSLCLAQLAKKKKDALIKSPPKSKRRKAKLTSVETSSKLDAQMSSKPIIYFNGADFEKQKKLHMKPSEVVQSSREKIYKKQKDLTTSLDANKNTKVISNGTVKPSITIIKSSNLPAKGFKRKIDEVHNPCSNESKESGLAVKYKAVRKSKKEAANKQTSNKLCSQESNKLENLNSGARLVVPKNASTDKNFRDGLYSTAAVPKICAPEIILPTLLPSISVTLVDVKASKAAGVVRELIYPDIELIKIEEPKKSLNNTPQRKTKRGKLLTDSKFPKSVSSKDPSSIEESSNSSSSKESENSIEEVKEVLDKVVNCVDSNKSKMNLKRKGSKHQKKVINQSSSPRCFESSNEVSVKPLSKSIENTPVVSEGIIQNGDSSSSLNDLSELQKTSNKRKFNLRMTTRNSSGMPSKSLVNQPKPNQPVAKTKKAGIQLEPVNDETSRPCISEPLDKTSLDEEGRNIEGNSNLQSSINQNSNDCLNGDMVKGFCTKKSVSTANKTDIGRESSSSTGEKSVGNSEESENSSDILFSRQISLKNKKQISCTASLATTDMKAKSSEFCTLQVGNGNNTGEIGHSHPCQSTKDQETASPMKGEEGKIGSSLSNANSPTQNPNGKSKEPKLDNILSSEFETQDGVTKFKALQKNQSDGILEKNVSKSMDSNFKASQLGLPSSASSDHTTLKELLSSVPKDGIIVRKSTNSDSEFLCIKCCKKLRSQTECCWHYSKCNFQFGEAQSVSLKDIAWICNLCRSNFNAKETLGNHECHNIDMRVSVPSNINRYNLSLVPIQSALVTDTVKDAQGKCSQSENNDSRPEDPITVAVANPDTGASGRGSHPENQDYGPEDPIKEAAANAEHSSSQVDVLEFSENVLETDFGDDQPESVFRPQIASVCTMLEDQKTDSEGEVDKKEDKKPDLKPLQVKMEARFTNPEVETSISEESFNIFNEQPLAFDVVSQRLPQSCQNCNQPFKFSPRDLDMKLNVRILKKSKISFNFLAMCKNCDHKHFSNFSLPVVSLEDSFKKVFIDYMSGKDKDAETTRYFLELCKVFSSRKNGDFYFREPDFLNLPSTEASAGMDILPTYSTTFGTEGPSFAQSSSLNSYTSENSTRLDANQETLLQSSLRSGGTLNLPGWSVPQVSSIHGEPMNFPGASMPGTFSLFQSRSGDALGSSHLENFGQDSSSHYEPRHSSASGSSSQYSLHQNQSNSSDFEVSSQNPISYDEPMDSLDFSGPQISSCHSVADFPGTSSMQEVQGHCDPPNSDCSSEVFADRGSCGSLYSASLVASISKNADIHFIRNFEKPDTYIMGSTHYCSYCFLSIPKDKISEHYYFKHDSSHLKREINVFKFSHIK